VLTITQTLASSWDPSTTEHDGRRSLTDRVRLPAPWNAIPPVDASESQTANGYSTRKTGLHSLALRTQTVARELPGARDVEKSSAKSSWMLLSGDELGENPSTRLLHNVNRCFGLEPCDSFPGAGLDRPEGLINCNRIRSNGESQRIALFASQMMPAEASDESSTLRDAIGVTRERRFLKTRRAFRSRPSARTTDLLGTSFDHASIKCAASHTHKLLLTEKTRHAKRWDMLTTP
jgi:hypothetical protein